MKPKRIVFTTTGSLGDLHPFLALGVAMLRRGHNVTVATAPTYRQRVEKHGLNFAPMRPDRPNDPAFHAVFMDLKTGPEFVFRQYLSPAIAQSYDDLTAAVQNADLLVSQSLALAAPLVAAKTGIPWVSGFFQPMTLSSTYDPPHLPPLPFLRNGTSMAQKWNEKILSYAKKYTLDWVRDVTAFKQSLGLPGDKHPIYEDHHASRLMLAMFSPLYGTPQPDWPPQTVQTGIAMLEQSEDAAVVEKLDRFFAAGAPPLVFTLGSSSSENAKDFYAVAVQAARKLCRRAIVVTTGLSQDTPLPEARDDILQVEYAPYAKMFDRAAVVIHAGGVATGFVAMQCGKPQLIVPFAHDQIDNAARLERLGVARVLPLARYNVDTLATALRNVLAHPKMARKAREVAPIALAENGVVAACDALERVLADA